MKNARRGLRTTRAYQTRRASLSFGRAAPSPLPLSPAGERGRGEGAARHRTTTWTWHFGTLRRRTNRLRILAWQIVGICREVLATRKPAPLLSLDGRFVLRLAERTFDAALLNVPPRNGRLHGPCPTEAMFTEQPPPQSIGIGLPGMANPAQDATAGVREADLVVGILLWPQLCPSVSP